MSGTLRRGVPALACVAHPAVSARLADFTHGLNAVAAVGGRRDSTTAIVDVMVIPMDRERTLPHQTVLVRGDRIVAVGPAKQVRVPPGAMRVDGAGKYLIPGLADMHVHIGYPMRMADDSTFEKTLFFYLANGVTTVRDMHGGCDSSSPQLALKRAVASGAMLGPRIYVAGDPDRESPAVAARSIGPMKALGYDFVKMIGARWVPLDQRRAMVDSVAAAARRAGLPVVGHAQARPDDGVQLAQAIPYRSVEHFTGYLEAVVGITGKADFDGVTDQATTLVDTAAWMRPDYRPDPARLRALALGSRRAGVWHCPTLSIIDGLAGPGALTPAQYARLHPAAGPEGPSVSGSGAFMAAAAQPHPPPAVRVLRRLLDLQRALTKAFADAGVGLLLGTDQSSDILRVPYGFEVHRELALMVQSGLTPYQALATGTRNAAEFLGTLDSTGTVQVGKRADLVLLHGNPLVDVGYTAGVVGVMAGGRWIPRAEIDARLDAWRTYGYGGGAMTFDLGAVRREVWGSR